MKIDKANINQSKHAAAKKHKAKTQQHPNHSNRSNSLPIPTPTFFSPKIALSKSINTLCRGLFSCAKGRMEEKIVGKRPKTKVAESQFLKRINFMPRLCQVITGLG